MIAMFHNRYFLSIRILGFEFWRLQNGAFIKYKKQTLWALMSVAAG
jgi:hypothetical protein|tara:strand:- start:410 stop:547 length:138 start_codon:yes stop_codon:yes gene_type:complete